MLDRILYKLKASAKDNSTDNNLNETAALKMIMDVVDGEFEYYYKVTIYIYY